MIRYAFSGDEIVSAGAAPTALDDGDFWGGATLCGVAVALAAAIVPVRPAFAADDDFVAPAAPSTVVDEDYPPVAVSQPTPWLRLYLPDPEELPAGSLFGVPEEDAWRAPLFAQGPPSRPAFSDDSDAAFTVAATLAPDEDFWDLAPPWPTQTAPPRAFSDDSDFVVTVAAALAPDEDFWAPPLPAQPPCARLYLPDGDDLAVTAVTATLGVDEDAWLPARPVVAPSPRLYLPDPDELAVTAVVATIVDEDAWVPPVPRPAPRLPWLATDTDDIVPQPAPTVVDDEPWQPPARPLALFPRLYLPDAEDAPAGFLRGQPDEDFWILAPRTVAVVSYFRPPTLFDADGMVPQPVQTFGRTLAGILGRQDAYALLGRQDGPTLLGRVDALGLLGRQDALALLGRQDAYSIPGANMPLSAAVSIPLGDDVVIPMTLQDPDTTSFDLTGCTITVGIKKYLTDSTALISKTIANGGVVVTNAAGGLANLILNASDTALLGAGAYPFDVQVTTGAGKKATLIAGTITLTDHPTR